MSDTTINTTTDILDLKRALMLAVHAGELMLENGAETSRVEGTINALLESFGIDSKHSLVTPTGLYVSADHDEAKYPLTVVRRVRRRFLNYSRIASINSLSRRVREGKLTLEEAESELQQIEFSPNPYPFWFWLLAGTITAAATTVLLGGGLLDILPAFVSTALVVLLQLGADKAKIPGTIGDMFGAALGTVIALLLDHLGVPIRTDLVIAGSIIRLVPGAALLAAVQDGITGDLLSSASRGLEMFIKGAAVASGVGLALSLFASLGYTHQAVDSQAEVWMIPIQVLAAFLAACFSAISSNIPRYAILTAGLAGSAGWFNHLWISRLTGSTILATFIAAFIVGIIGWGLARWQHSPVLLYILPGALPLLPGLTIYQGMLALAQNQVIQGMILLVQAVFLGGALAVGVAISDSIAPRLWQRPQFIKKTV